ncbi:hypothetical protein K7X08_015782 [Anisodus acutangulus]|uniref:Pentatricopeptide repeat-containing protein n=1 Tax=Anisodus acutangulus TaxID=402998 RepID=A0A9Q1LDL3_9SOLA|nr:hypothetical protein K7X08_015782 [Anisodus acutangulus]
MKSKDLVSWNSMTCGYGQQGHAIQAIELFEEMKKQKPELDHYSCIIDLLGRARLLEEAREFITNMTIQPNGVIWGSLLISCGLQGNFRLGIEAAENRLVLEPGSKSTHLQLPAEDVGIRGFKCQLTVQSFASSHLCLTGLICNPRLHVQYRILGN